MQVNSAKADRYLRALIWAVIIAGAIFRIYAYIQNRNLVLDEANVARNIFEKGFAGLSGRLAYEQYAPPIFLYIVKLITMLAGYSEYAFRIYPLLCGILSLYVLYRLLAKLMPLATAWYPLAILAFGFTFVRYSTELKQYMPDVLCTLSLLLLALSVDINQVRKAKFVAAWLLAGSIAIWSSMPSVFILAGVGAYYMLRCVEEKKYRNIWQIIIPALLWVVQFALYYFLLLKEQSDSGYLQDFHSPYFLRPHMDAQSWQHNWKLLQSLVAIVGGYTAIAMYFHLSCILIACAALVYTRRPLAALLLVPIGALLIAALLGRFSLLDRVSLFIMPVLLLLIGYGVNFLVHHARHVAIKALPVLVALICITSFAVIGIQHPYCYEEIGTGLHLAKCNKVNDEDLFVHHSTMPAHIYYTTIHPGKARWAGYRNANVLVPGANVDSLCAALPAKATPYMFLYTNSGIDDAAIQNPVAAQTLQPGFMLERKYLKCYLYRKPAAGG